MIELNFDQLPDGNETLGVLRQENARLSYWVTLAVCINILIDICFDFITYFEYRANSMNECFLL